MTDRSLGIFGLGRVGCVSAACLGARGFQVCGVDVDARRVELLNRGSSPIAEPGVPELLGDAWRAGRLRTTTDVAECVAQCTVSFICLATPGSPTGELDLTALGECVRSIGRALRTLPQRHLVIVRSTVPPGTMDRLVVPAIEEASGKRAGTDVGIVFNPEFMREGSAVADFQDPPIRVVAATDAESFARAAALYGCVEASVRRLDFRSAEVLKLVCNAFHGLKVAFANEVDALCSAWGADSAAVMDVFCSDRKLNISPHYLAPGLAFGGACLSKDIRSIVHEANRAGLRVPLIESILPSNELRLLGELESIAAAGGRRFCLLGLASKGGSDDLRGSPAIRLGHSLVQAGFEVRLYEPALCNGTPAGLVHERDARELGVLAPMVLSSPDEAIAFADVVILANDDPRIRGALERIPEGKRLIDLAPWGSRSA